MDRRDREQQMLRRQVPLAPLGFQDYVNPLRQWGIGMPPLDFRDITGKPAQSSEPPIAPGDWSRRVVGPPTQAFNEMQGLRATPPYQGEAALAEYWRRQQQQYQAFEDELWNRGSFDPDPPPERQGGPGMFGGIPRGGGY